MADDLHPRPSAHFTPPWSTVKNIVVKDLDKSCIGQKIVFDWQGETVSGLLDGYANFRNGDVYFELNEAEGPWGPWSLPSDHDVSVFYNFDGETDGNPEYVRGIGVLMLWGVLTVVVGLAILLAIWKWS